jgi:hypothetical protein
VDLHLSTSSRERPNMRSPWPLALYPLLLSQAVADSTFNKICSGIKDVWGCSKSFDFPTGAKVKTCKNKFVEVG